MVWDRRHKDIFGAATVLLLLLVAALSSVTDSYAQYYGRNKPGYSSFDFDVLQTPHFEINNYTRSGSTGVSLHST
jgi:hypothetical protein